MLVNSIDFPRRLLTTKEASLLLNVHHNTLRRWCDEGKIRFYRLGIRGDRRFPENDIEAVRAKMHKNNGYLPRLPT